MKYDHVHRSVESVEALRAYFSAQRPDAVRPARGVYVSTATRRAVLLGEPGIVVNGRNYLIKFVSKGGGVWVAYLGGIREGSDVYQRIAKAEGGAA